MYPTTNYFPLQSSRLKLRQCFVFIGPLCSSPYIGDTRFIYQFPRMNSHCTTLFHAWLLTLQSWLHSRYIAQYVIIHTVHCSIPICIWSIWNLCLVFKSCIHNMLQCETISEDYYGHGCIRFTFQQRAVVIWKESKTSSFDTWELHRMICTNCVVNVCRTDGLTRSNSHVAALFQDVNLSY